MLRHPTAEEIRRYVEDARHEVHGAPSETERNMRAAVIVELANQIARLTAPDLVVAISKEVHLGEWCPEREKCRSGTSAASDAAAKAAIKIVMGRLASEESR